MKLNPALDLVSLSANYRERQRLQVHDFLVPEAADRIYRCLVEETPWGLIYNEGEKIVKLGKPEFAALPPQEKQRLMIAALQRARKGFQFIYHQYPMVEYYLEKRNPTLFLNQVLEFLNTPEILDFARAVTGIATMVKAGAQATLYAPGHFLTYHDDAPAQNRRVAYVLSLTKDWHPDWGGLLQFYDRNRAITDIFMPRFNALSLFTVPQYHAVTFVPPYAPIGRYSITGWFLYP